MIYKDEARAAYWANKLNRELRGYGQHKAALTAHGWTVRRNSPYSNGDVIRWSSL